MSMRVAVIADLHMGPPGVETFGHTDVDFSRRLKYLEDKHDIVILLGDVVETLTSKKIGNHKETFWSAWKRYPLITARIERGLACGRYLYIRGNHDLVAKETVGAIDSFGASDTAGRRWTFVHGHDQDSLWNASYGNHLVFLAGWTHRLGVGFIHRCSVSIETRRHACTSTFVNNIARFAQETKSTFVVTGHTHHAGRFKAGDAELLNPGECAFGRWGFLSIDLETKQFDFV